MEETNSEINLRTCTNYFKFEIFYFLQDHYLVNVAIVQMWGCCLPLYWLELRTRSVKSMGEKGVCLVSKINKVLVFV